MSSATISKQDLHDAFNFALKSVQEQMYAAFVENLTSRGITIEGEISKPVDVPKKDSKKKSSDKKEKKDKKKKSSDKKEKKDSKKKSSDKKSAPAPKGGARTRPPADETIMQKMIRVLNTKASQDVVSGAYFNVNTGSKHSKTVVTSTTCQFFIAKNAEAKSTGRYVARKFIPGELVFAAHIGDDNKELEQMKEELEQEGWTVETEAGKEKTPPKGKKTSSDKKEAPAKKVESKPVGGKGLEGKGLGGKGLGPAKPVLRPVLEVVEKDGVYRDAEDYVYDHATQLIIGFYDASRKSKTAPLTEEQIADLTEKKKKFVPITSRKDLKAATKESNRSKMVATKKASKKATTNSPVEEKKKVPTPKPKEKEPEKELFEVEESEEEDGEGILAQDVEDMLTEAQASTKDKKGKAKVTEEVEEEVEEDQNTQEDEALKADVDEAARDFAKVEEEQRELEGNSFSQDEKDYIKADICSKKIEMRDQTSGWMNEKQLSRESGLSVERIGALKKKTAIILKNRDVKAEIAARITEEKSKIKAPTGNRNKSRD